MRLVPSIGVPFAALSLVASCSLFVDLDGLNEPQLGDVGNDAADASLSCDGDACAAVLDAGATRDGGDAAVDAGPCPSSLPGPPLVAAAGFCIDATEVTVAQYNEFLATTPNVPQAPECGWNTSYALQTNGGQGCSADKNDVTKHPSFPATCLDWCDAVAYCTWAGKNLCGSTADGGGVPFDQAAQPSAEWFLACATPAHHTYPTGDTYDGGCNTIPAGGGGSTRDVAADPRCTGGYPGLYDLAGNVEEWIAACDTSGGADRSQDQCHEAGDSWGYAELGTARCDNLDSDVRSGQYDSVGFRCCAPLR